jgi:hypothetical protein
MLAGTIPVLEHSALDDAYSLLPVSQKYLFLRFVSQVFINNNFEFSV